MSIKIIPIKPLFYLYAALNYNGYDKENNSQGMHLLRKKIREELEKIKASTFNFPYHPYQYTKQILTIDENLDPTEDTNPDFFEAIEYVKRFSQEAGLDELWPKVKKATEKELEKYKPIVFEIGEKLPTFFDFSPELNQAIFTVNLLESYWRGFSIVIDDKAYLITGPSDSPNTRNILHEFVHLYVNQLNLNDKDISQVVIDKIPENLRKNYQDKIIEESLVRALVVFLSSKIGAVNHQTLSKQDKELILPEIILRKLEKAKKAKLNTEDLNRLIL